MKFKAVKTSPSLSRISSRLRAFAVILLLTSIIGCKANPQENIPRYRPMDVQASLQAMRDRSAAVRDISGEGAVTLTDEKGGSVRLDAAFVFAPPDRARVRTYKFSQAVLDLTVKPDGLWLFIPRQDDRASQLRDAAGNTGQAVRQWLALLAGQEVQQGDDVKIVGDRIHITRKTDGLTTRSEIDRATLTARRFAVVDSAGVEQFTLTLSDYRVLEPTVWPGKIIAVSPTGTIVIESRNVEANVAPAAAFNPPARAERLQ